jgi:bacteriorhodopsin
MQLSLYTIMLWLIYPIIFALGEGAGRISPSAETIAYTILDIFSKAMFGLWLVARHKHDSAEESAVVLPESWTEPRGAKTGAIQLPVGDRACSTS